MTYTHNPNDPMVLLANKANTLLQQYNSNTISLQEFKDSMNTQVIPSVTGLNTSSHNDDAMHTISYAVAMVGSPE
jgi:hypothetical protein